MKNKVLGRFYLERSASLPFAHKSVRGFVTFLSASFLFLICFLFMSNVALSKGVPNSFADLAEK